MGLLTLLVHNEAMKVDPKEIYGWRVYALACSVSATVRDCGDDLLTMHQACFGGMLFGMDSGIIGGVLTLDNFKA